MCPLQYGRCYLIEGAGLSVIAMIDVHTDDAAFFLEHKAQTGVAVSVHGL